ncbi:MAG: LON peptidase substrate-binding domain-containing protein [Bacteroidetes bacterium]|nr:LON peptidase substrate-binding domain-containing protein [Bacteroidota bacterium]
MTNFVPIFPLEIVVFPGEPLNLHIFEPQYKQLIRECIESKKPFGIPSVFDKKIGELGTLMEIVEVVKEYETGELDIRTRGLSVFRILEVIKEIPDKLYHGAIVNYPENTMEPGDTNISNLILSEVKRMYNLLNVQGKFPEGPDAVISYSIGHFVGLTKEQEYEMLGIFTEIQRLEYLRRHLNTILPVVQELEEIKARVQRNGHFRDLSIEGLEL